MKNLDINKKPCISILLHSDSFINSNQLSTFLELNLTEYIDIDVTPTKNNELIDLFNRNSIHTHSDNKSIKK